MTFFASSSAIPAAPRYFTQPLDHFAAAAPAATTFKQRYYQNDTSFGGPGSPLLVIMGGEGAIPPSTGFFYPWVVDVLAPQYEALVLEPEHRFYGTSVPADAYELPTLRHLTPQQALADTVALIRAVQQEKGCTPHGTAGYCPVITIGGSYPGWLSAMARLRYPAVVDGAYAASAPMRFYAQQVDQYAYYRVVTASAERAATGCAAAVRSALALVASADTRTLTRELDLCSPLPPYMSRGGDATTRTELILIVAVGFAGLNMANCTPPPTEPPTEPRACVLCKVCSAKAVAARPLMVPASLGGGADPPGPQAGLTRACRSFLDAQPRGAAAQWAALRGFLGGDGALRFQQGRGLADVRFGSGGASGASTSGASGGSDASATAPAGSRCVNVTATLPATGKGGEGTFSCGDWSGCGSGYNGLSWDYETCTFLIEQIGTNNVTDMVREVEQRTRPPRARGPVMLLTSVLPVRARWQFPPREWTFKWLDAHCAARFQVVPKPRALVGEWGYDAAGLKAQGASRILWTNGLNDGWSAGGFTEDIDAARDLRVINMPSGAHHSDLSHSPPGPWDTPDVVAARANGSAIVARWIEEARSALPLRAGEPRTRKDPRRGAISHASTHASTPPLD